MAEVSRDIDAPASHVWDVIADGWSYAGWVVGASHIRKVDAGWPAVGTRIHHSVGAWPATLEDTTEVTAVETGRMVQLAARAWPTGVARVRIELEPMGHARTRVRMVEQAESGPAKLLPDVVQDTMLTPRNVETLSRLADLTLRRSG